jgi:hypothetical protein
MKEKKEAKMNKQDAKKEKPQEYSFNSETVNQLLKTIVSAVQAGNQLIKKEKKNEKGYIVLKTQFQGVKNV